ncbi:PEP-CTERM sorting domain-containing protein [Corallincola luteus]|uniref:PEP-CTERM sorting domain-containing protein n=1 Tax=Corallincola luteus TaxID=1775177 RepID=A0ABY2AJZ1_9GAMM|nr:PEP-CTERM sorting domain-containing protein [Corallincola luteus]TCI02590.1 PEP-CTERM sorting domain-containing protein [Corallincola luteus]
MNKFVNTLIAATAMLTTSFGAFAGVMYTNTGLASADTTLTFDEVVLADGTALTNQYSAFGITFAGAFYNPQAQAFPPATDGNQIGNFFPAASPWSIMFDNDIEEAAFGIATNQNSTLVEVLLDSVVVDFVSANTDFDGTDFFQITGLVFDEIRLTTTGDMLALVDNLQFSAKSDVPEPVSVALLGLLLAGLGYSRRSV